MELNPLLLGNGEFDYDELIEQSQASWDKFYKHNQDKFFKNRNYLSFAFEVMERKLEE